MSKITTYYLIVKDVMRGSVMALEYSTYKELAEGYNRYSKDNDYEVLTMHSTSIETVVIRPEELTVDPKVKQNVE